MGYTHYWKMPDKRMSEEVIDDIQRVFERHKDVIQREVDNNEKPMVNDGLIAFNGIGEDCYETFYLDKGKEGFCKTNNKPYDIAVCETLLVLKHHYGNEFELGSDGFYVGRDDLESGVLDGTWNEAIANVTDHYGYKFELIPVVEGGYYSFDVVAKNEHSKEQGHEVELYFYNGFGEPEKIDDVKELSIESNYLGDVTEEFMEEYEFYMKDGDVADFQENQFVSNYGVWVNPTKEQLQEFNKSVLLDEEEHLQDFEGCKLLKKNKQKNNDLER